MLFPCRIKELSRVRVFVYLVFSRLFPNVHICRPDAILKEK